MMATNIYDSYEKFLARDDKKDNGVSVDFAANYTMQTANPRSWDLDNESNEGCWNCLDCSHLTDCSYCTGTHYSQHCYHLAECWNCHYCSYLTNTQDQRYIGGKNKGDNSFKYFKKLKLFCNKMRQLIRLKGKY
jgi:hypothetical protein